MRHGFVHVFSPYLVPFRGFVSTPKNKKSTPNFFRRWLFKASDAHFSLLKAKSTEWQPFSKFSQNSKIFDQKFSRAEFLNYGGVKWPFLSISFAKQTSPYPGRFVPLLNIGSPRPVHYIWVHSENHYCREIRRSSSPPLKGRGQGWGLYIIDAQDGRDPAPTPPLEGRGTAAHCFWVVF